MIKIQVENAQRRTKRQDGKRVRKLDTGRGEKTHKEKLKEGVLNCARKR